MRIAILEDDPSQLELFSYWLTSAGHHVVPFERGKDFLSATGKESFETLIFDWNLPDITGIDVLRRVRANSKVAVLFCTARAEVDDVVKALSEGADDYLIKPLRLELLARIESVARRAGQVQAKDDAVSIGDLQANFIGRKISRSWQCA